MSNIKIIPFAIGDVVHFVNKLTPHYIAFAEFNPATGVCRYMLETRQWAYEEELELLEHSNTTSLGILAEHMSEWPHQGVFVWNIPDTTLEDYATELDVRPWTLQSLVDDHRRLLCLLRQKDDSKESRLGAILEEARRVAKATATREVIYDMLQDMSFKDVVEVFKNRG